MTQTSPPSHANLIIYNASAGSGKTYTLSVEYVVLCLKDEPKRGIFNPTGFQKILAITFTNKAANELKERILRFMAELAEWETDSTADVHLLNLVSTKTALQSQEVIKRARLVYERMIFDYTDIHVSTIDKFVLSILRSFFKELGLPADFNIQLDQAEMVSRIRDKIIEQVGQDSALTNQLLNFLLAKADNDKAWRLKEDLDTFLGELLKEEGMAVMTKVNNDGYEKYSQAVKSKFEQAKKGLEAIQTSFQDALKRHGVDASDFKGGNNGFMNPITKSSKDLADKWIVHEPNGWTQKQQEVFESDSWLSAKGKNNGANVEAIRPELESLFKQLWSAHADYYTWEPYYKTLLALQLLPYLKEHLAEIEEEDSLTLLSTNNSRISGVVRSNPAPFIYERLGERFDHFLLDEFQDTSVMQWQNFLPLITESLSKGGKSFIVGDGKQSIYRWRSGEVEQFVALPKIFAKDGGPFHEEYEKQLERSAFKMPLSTNYRSKNEVIAFNNKLYDLIQDTLSDDLKTVYDGQRQEVKSPDNTGGLVEMVAYLSKTLKEEEIDFKTKSLEDVILKVKDCRADGYAGSDIVMLVRSHGDAQFLANGLSEAGFKVLSNESFFLSRHILSTLVVAMMAHLDDPDKTGPRLQAVSQLLRLHQRQSEYQEMAERFVANAATPSLRNFLAELDLEFNPTNYIELDLYGTAERIIRDLKLDGSNAYLLELLHLCAERSIRKSSGLREFIEFWEEGGKKSSLKLPEATDAIRIMTIHKSKGLQFPVVFIPFYRGKSSDNTLDYLWVETGDSNVPKVIVDNKKTLACTTHADIRKNEVCKNALDQANLLYVATTRAVDRLYLHFNDSALGRPLLDFLGKNENAGESAPFIGNRQRVPASSDESTNLNYPIVDFERGDWRRKLRVSMGSEQAFAEQRERGIIIHDALAGIEIPSSSPYYEEAMSVKTAVYTMPTYAQWMSEGYTARHEIELLDMTGHSHRPDTVFFSQDQTIVVDYKTGARRDAHSNQVRKYVGLLEDMGYQNVSGHLLYTDELILDQVT